MNCYFIGHFTKTLKGKFTFSKSPPQAPLGSEDLRKRLINPPLDKGGLDPRVIVWSDQKSVDSDFEGIQVI